MARVTLSESSHVGIGELVKKSLQIDVKRSLRSIGQTMVPRVQAVFDGQGKRQGFGPSIKSRLGAKWERTSPLARSKRRNIASRKATAPTLIDTKAYKQSIKMIQIFQSSNIVTMELGSTDEKKAMIHEFGALVDFGEGRKEVPARQVHFFVPSDELIVIDAVNRAFGNG